MDAYRDAINIKNAIPWLAADQEVEQFLSAIPQDLHHLRNHLALYKFFKDKDKGLNIPVIEKEAREIVDILKDVPLEQVKYSLLILGDLPNRKEVVLRQLIHSVRDRLSHFSSDDFMKRKRKDLIIPSNENPSDNSKVRRTNYFLEMNQNSCDQSNDQTITTSVPETSYLPDSSSANNSESTILNGLSEETVIQNNENNDWFDDDIDMLLNDVQEVITVSTNENNVIDLDSTENNVKKTEIIDLDSCEPSTSKGYQSVDCDPKSKGKIIFTNKGTPRDCRNDFLVSPNKKLKPATISGSSFQEVPVINRPFTSTGYRNSIDGAASFKLTWNKPSTVTSLENDLEPEPSTSNASNPHFLRHRMSIMGNTQNMPWLEDTKPSAPSTSKYYNLSIQQKTQPTSKTYDLVQHLHEITNKSKEEIQMYCDSRNLIVTRAPSAIVLNEIVDSLIQAGSAPVSDFSDDERDDSPIYREDNWMDIPSDDPESLPEILPPIQPSVDLTNSNPQIITNSNTNPNLPLINRIKEMFPEACPKYVEEICKGKTMNQLDDIVTVILCTEDKYPKRETKPSSPERELDPEEQYNLLSEILADADPTYLRMQCDLYRNNSEGLKQFIANAIETKRYPTLKEYTRKQQLSAQQKQYTSEFNVENFVQIFPDPFATFTDPKRKLQLSTYDVHFVSIFLRNQFDKVSVRDIARVMTMHNNSLAKCLKDLNKLVKNGNVMKSRRKPTPLPSNIQNIPLLQEVAFFGHREEIKQYIGEKKKAEEQERREAKLAGLMETCTCCYDDEVMPKECFTCEKGCKYCKSCINKYCEVQVGEGKMDFPCMSECDALFSLQTLQCVLAPKMFSKVAQKKALAEVKAAGIEELEMCPFCDFATIPYEADKIFRCFNGECMKESCRLCKEPSHVPLKCDEVEKDADVKARTYIEDKMTEALLRECWKCHTKFFKEEGCNKMTCSCGAHMCYICSKPVKDYSHFNGLGGDKHHLCPLYSDTNALNEQNVLKGAEAAKAQIDPSKLKVDPTVDVKQHYKERSKKVPREPHMEVLRAQPNPLGLVPDDLLRIQERRRVAFFGHREEIKQYIAEKKKAEEQERKEAKLLGLMETCTCCYDDEVMPKDCFTCEKGCKYCKSCINKYCEVQVGEGKMDFPCMSECDALFSLQTLQNVLAPKMFSKVAQKKALAEVKAAGIEELEMCPFCDFATIPYETDKIFRCFNGECMKESCRLCKEPSHVPLKCDEVEKDADVKARTYIEDKMTEALLRECWKCHTKFFKEEGCNKMTCSCGAHMCYICSKPVKDYSHFNGLGGDKHHLCPLYSDTNALNEQNVLKGAEAAKAQIDPSKLKVDPTVDVKQHYKERSKKVPREPHMEVLRAQPNPLGLVPDDLLRIQERRRIQRLQRRLQQVMNNRAQWGHF